MDAALFTKMLSDKSVLDLKKLGYKYPQADMGEFVSLLKNGFYHPLPLKDFSGQELVYLDSVAQVHLSAARILLTPQSSTQLYGAKAMEEEIISTFTIEQVDFSRDSVRKILSGFAPADESENRIYGMKKGLEFISDPANRITEASIHQLYETAIGAYLPEEDRLHRVRMLLTAGRLIKYDLKELFKKHIALYIVTLLAAFGCWALHVLSEYVPDNGITPVAYPVMIAVYVIVCVVLFIVSIVFVILYFRRSMLKDEGYLTHTLPVPVWLIYVCKLISGYIIYLVNFVVIVVSVCIAIARVDWIWRVPESINEQLNVLGYKGSFCTLIIILIILSGIYMYAMFFFCMCMGYTANGNRDAFSFVTYIAVYIVGQILNVIVLLLTPIKGNGNMFEEMIKESVTGSDVAFTFEEFGHIMTGSVVVSVVMFFAFVVASIYILDKKLNLE